jgi:hypothetical protein
VTQGRLAVSTETRHVTPLKCSLKWLSRKSDDALNFCKERTETRFTSTAVASSETDAESKLGERLVKRNKNQYAVQKKKKPDENGDWVLSCHCC